MHAKQIVAVALCVALTALQGTVGITPALAGGNVIRSSFQFTWPAGSCPGLDVALTFSGESVVVDNIMTKADGRFVEIFNNAIHGIATDSAGKTYRFNYHNHTSVDVPPSGGFGQVKVTDHFNLVGAGKANGLHTGFNLRITDLGAPGPSPEDQVQIVSLRGDPEHCDPF